MSFIQLSETPIFLIISVFITLIFALLSGMVMISIDELEDGLTVLASFLVLILAFFNGAGIGGRLRVRYGINHYNLYWNIGLTVGIFLTLMLFVLVWLSIYYIKMKRNYQAFVKDNSVYIFEDNELQPISVAFVAAIFLLGWGLTRSLSKFFGGGLIYLPITLLPIILGIVFAIIGRHFVLWLLCRMFLKSGLVERAMAEKKDSADTLVPMSEEKREVIHSYRRKGNVVFCIGFALYLFGLIFTLGEGERLFKFISYIVMAASFHYYKKANDLRKWRGKDEPDNVDTREVLYKMGIDN